jgi:hypothetical protein
VTVALLEDNLPIAYGVVRDISERGACIMTDSVLSPGRSYQFRMSFFGGEILEAVVRVVWHEAGSSHLSAGGVPHGLEFTEIPAAQLQTLKRILGDVSFGAKSEH